MSRYLQLYEYIIDGAPGVGKTTLINNIYEKLHKYFNEELELNAIILINGAKPEEHRDEFVLLKPSNGSMSFIQKRYDPKHCYESENIYSIMFLHREVARQDQELQKRVTQSFPYQIIINIKERDGPSSALIFNWTSYKDVVLAHQNKVSKYILSWDHICHEVEAYLKLWMKTIKKEKIIKHFIYLQASPDFIYHRVKQRNREFEADSFTKTLAISIVGAYNFFFNDKKNVCETLSHSIFDLYDQKLTSYWTVDAQTNCLDSIVLNYIKKLPPPCI
jgi:deoxyadenosine/deoxycytidine kinase